MEVVHVLVGKVALRDFQAVTADVDAGHVVAPPGKENRMSSGSARYVEDLGMWTQIQCGIEKIDLLFCQFDEPL